MALPADPAEPQGGLRDTLSADALLEAGYCRFHDPFSAALLRQYYLGSYQLSFADLAGVRYTIAICHGARSEDEEAVIEYFSPEAQFTRGGLRFNVEMLYRGQTLAEIEDFFAALWTTMKLDYAEGLDGGISPSQAVRH